MKYINRKTGAVINTASAISGGDWEKAEQPKKPERNKPKKGD